MAADHTEDEGPSTELLEIVSMGSDFAGAALGGAVGLLGGPGGVVAGAAAGVAVTRALRHVGNQVVSQIVGKRPAVRVGAAFVVAAEEISTRLKNGEEPRSDGFFDSEGDQRPAGEELLEGVLLRAAEAYEERKVRHLGHLYAAVAFDATVAASEANFLLNLANRLTYRGFVLLHLFGDVDWVNDIADAEGARPENARIGATANAGLISEMNDLGNYGLLGIDQGAKGFVATYQSVIDGGDFTRLPLTKVALTRIGERLYELLRLAEMPYKDVRDVLDELGSW